MDKEQELKHGLEGLCTNVGISGHLLLYLDDNKIRFTGNMTLSSLAPLLLKVLAEKFK